MIKFRNTTAAPHNAGREQGVSRLRWNGFFRFGFGVVAVSLHGRGRLRIVELILPFIASRPITSEISCSIRPIYQPYGPGKSLSASQLSTLAIVSSAIFTRPILLSISVDRQFAPKPIEVVRCDLVIVVS